jgi:hypothetical protein
MAYVDSVGNRYQSVPPAKFPPKQGPSKTNRKFGRRKNKPSAKRYLSERRWEKNKARRAARRAFAATRKGGRFAIRP